VVVASGGDNISTYSSIFAGCTGGQLALTVAVIYALTGVWLVIGHRLVRVPVLAQAMITCGDYVVPALLLAIGVYILHEDGTWTMLQGVVGEGSGTVRGRVQDSGGR
jgi:cadmium resistance protein CadD (predicted permease)